MDGTDTRPGQVPMTLTVLGVRGSLPVPSGDVLGYGGNTSCMAVRFGEELLFLDAGSGLAGFSGHGERTCHILLSHLHLDHVIGLPGFRLLFDPGAEVHLYGAGGDLRARLGALFAPPYWPVELTGFPARVVFHDIAPGDSFSPVPGLTASTLRSCHPNGSVMYRLDGGGHSLVYTLDCEPDDEVARTLPDFARNADLMVWDACFAPGELKAGWGHSTWEQGLEYGRRAGVGRVLMSHYERGYHDTFLTQQERLAAQCGPNCLFAREGMVLEL